MECLQKARKIAFACLESTDTARLLVELLNKFLYYYIQNNQEVLLSLIVRVWAHDRCLFLLKLAATDH
jgi:hypothetical protein